MPRVTRKRLTRRRWEALLARAGKPGPERPSRRRRAVDTPDGQTVPSAEVPDETAALLEAYPNSMVIGGSRSEMSWTPLPAIQRRTPARRVEPDPVEQWQEEMDTAARR